VVAVVAATVMMMMNRVGHYRKLLEQSAMLHNAALRKVDVLCAMNFTAET
jgi:hypothetical protein